MKEIKGIFDQNPNLFRALFCLVAVPILWLAGLNGWQLINRSSEQPFFQASVSRLYVMRDIPARNVVNRLQPYLSLKPSDVGWIRKGDMVRSINGVEVRTQAEAYRVLRSGGIGSLTRIEVQRPSKRDYFIEFEVMAELAADSVWEIPPTVYAWDVPSGGMAARAGLRQGDLIYMINGQQFKDKAEANRLMRDMTRGGMVNLGILRKGQWLDIEVPVARLTIPFSLIIYQLVGLYWLLAGLILALVRPGILAARLLGAGIFALGVAFMLFESRFGEIRSEGQVQVSLLFFYAGLALMMHSSYYFPRERPALLRNPWARYSSYVIMAIALLSSLVWGAATLPFAVTAFFATHLFVRRHYRSRTHVIGTRQGYILTGLAGVISATAVWWFLRDQMDENLALLIRAIPAAFLLLTYVITISRYRLLGLRIGRGLQYATATIAWSALILLAFLFGLELLAGLDLPPLNISFSRESLEIHGQMVDTRQQTINERIVLMLSAMLLGWALRRIGRRGYRFLRRKFHRTSYDHSNASHELTVLLSQKMSMEDLARGVVELLGRLMLLEKAGLVVFREDGSFECLGAWGFDSTRRIGMFRQESRNLSAAMKKFRGELCVDYMIGNLKSMFTDEGFQYLYPINSGDQLVGCLLIGAKLSEGAFRQEDFRFLAVRAGQVAGAIENAFLYEKLAGQERLLEQMEIARGIQLSSLPQEDPEIDGLDISAASIPALEVGGDYYDYFRNDNANLTIIVGDVSGKGMSAALYMSKMQGIISALHRAESGPHQLFNRVNPILYREMEASVFVTASCARIDTREGRLKLVRAGHLPLFIYRSGEGRVEAHQPSGMALGLNDRPLFSEVLEERDIGFTAGDVILLVSDGITEAFNGAQQVFGEERLTQTLNRIAAGTAREIRDAILEEVHYFSQGEEQNDDQTILVVKAVA